MEIPLWLYITSILLSPVSALVGVYLANRLGAMRETEAHQRQLERDMEAHKRGVEREAQERLLAHERWLFDKKQELYPRLISLALQGTTGDVTSKSEAANRYWIEYQQVQMFASPMVKHVLAEFQEASGELGKPANATEREAISKRMTEISLELIQIMGDEMQQGPTP